MWCWEDLHKCSVGLFRGNIWPIKAAETSYHPGTWHLRHPSCLPVTQNSLDFFTNFHKHNASWTFRAEERGFKPLQQIKLFPQPPTTSLWHLINGSMCSAAWPLAPSILGAVSWSEEDIIQNETGLEQSASPVQSSHSSHTWGVMWRNLQTFAAHYLATNIANPHSSPGRTKR